MKEKDIEKLVGMSIEAADFYAEAFGFCVRVITLNGCARAITHDITSNRVNVEVEDGVVTKINGFY